MNWLSRALVILALAVSATAGTVQPLRYDSDSYRAILETVSASFDSWKVTNNIANRSDLIALSNVVAGLSLSGVDTLGFANLPLPSSYILGTTLFLGTQTVSAAAYNDSWTNGITSAAYGDWGGITNQPAIPPDYGDHATNGYLTVELDTNALDVIATHTNLPIATSGHGPELDPMWAATSNDVWTAIGGAGGDDLGNHTATMTLDMGKYSITNVPSIRGTTNTLAIDVDARTIWNRSGTASMNVGEPANDWLEYSGNTKAVFLMRQANATADEGTWYFDAEGDALYWGTLSDSKGAGANYARITRSGITVDEFDVLWGSAGEASFHSTKTVLGAGVNVLIGTTTDDGVHKLQVDGDVAVTGSIYGDAGQLTNFPAPAWGDLTGVPAGFADGVDDTGGTGTGGGIPYFVLTNGAIAFNASGVPDAIWTTNTSGSVVLR